MSKLKDLETLATTFTTECVIRSLDALKGQRAEFEVTASKLQVRLSQEEPETVDKIDIVAEIAAVYMQEISAEITQELLEDARQNAAITKTLDVKNVKDIEELLKDAKEGSVVIVSPTFLTILFSEPSVDKERDEEMRLMTAVPYIGKLCGFDLLVDQYASHRQPVLVAEPGWFEYSGEDAFILGEIIEVPSARVEVMDGKVVEIPTVSEDRLLYRDITTRVNGDAITRINLENLDVRESW